MRLRLLAFLAAFLFLSSVAHAGVAEELIAAINNCAAMTDNGTRHACYDRLPTLLKSLAPVAAAAPVTAAPVAITAPVATAEAPRPTATQQKASPPVEEKDNSGGFFGLFASEPIPADHITATVESFTHDYGVFVVTLDNGQIWRQVTATGGLVRFSSEKKDEVTIWRNSFGEDVLRIKGYPVTYRVRRIK